MALVLTGPPPGIWASEAGEPAKTAGGEREPLSHGRAGLAAVFLTHHHDYTFKAWSWGSPAGGSLSMRLTMMSAASLKPSAILEATFSATWFGLWRRIFELNNTLAGLNSPLPVRTVHQHLS